jgi:hypothetical protein
MRTDSSLLTALLLQLTVLLPSFSAMRQTTATTTAPLPPSEAQHGLAIYGGPHIYGQLCQRTGAFHKPNAPHSASL